MSEIKDREVIISRLESLEPDGMTDIDTVKDDFKKMFILAAASRFEREIKHEIELYFKEKMDTNFNDSVEFIKMHILDRGYYKLFDWDAKNLNRFWRAFGSEPWKLIDDNFSKNEKYQACVTSFLKLGLARNKIIHDDLFMTQPPGIETIAEAKKSILEANKIVEIIPCVIRGDKEEVLKIINR